VVNFLQRRPASPLDLFVESLWVCRNESAPRRFERVLPSGAPQLVVNLAEDQTRVYREAPSGLICVTAPGSILSGITSHAQIIDTDEQAYVAGVSFRPGGTLPFVAQPADELAGTDVPLDAIWGGATTRWLRERLLSARAPADALDVLERALWDMWRDRGWHPAVAFALDVFRARPSVARVASVTAAVGLSEKRFIERFKSEVGVTPKRYCRLLRFQQVVATAHVLRDADWADVAASCGYADQAHLIHEFREFSGMTPRAYEQGKTAFQNHVSFLQS
jgi:AraC-like DNA-binding protein